MSRHKVIRIEDEGLVFDSGTTLFSDHERDCCEYHWLDFSQHTMEDFAGLEFDLESNSFFNRVDGYGIELLPVNGHPVRVPGYGDNNGYYSDQLDLVLEFPDKNIIKYDITDCQMEDDSW